MKNALHQWSMFQKGRLKIKACACCGEMQLPSNVDGVCEQKNILASPVVRAGYTLVIDMANSEKSGQKVA